MLTAHVRKYAYRGTTTYVGYVKCRLRHTTIWTESTGIHSLTKADARALAEELVTRYLLMSHHAEEAQTPHERKTPW
jgi:hypothetical protein